MSFNVEGFTRARINKFYPEPYYKIDMARKKAIAVFGNYVPQLFELQKETVLRTRGIFGKPDSMEIKDVQLEEVEDLSLNKKDSIELLKTWTSFVNAIKKNDTAFIRVTSFDSITCSVCEGMPRTEYENNLESIDMFIDSALVNSQKADMWSTIDKNNFKIHIIRYPERKPKEIPLNKGESLIVYDIDFMKTLKADGENYRQSHTFEFVKLGKKFHFYKMESY